MPRINIDEKLGESLTLVIGGQEFTLKDIPIDAFEKGLKIADQLGKLDKTKNEDSNKIFTALKNQLAYFLSMEIDDKFIQTLGVNTAQLALTEIMNWMTLGEGDPDSK